MRELWDSYEDIKERIQLYIETAYKTNDDPFNKNRKEFLSRPGNNTIYTDPIYEIIPRYPKSKIEFEELIRSCGIKESIGDEKRFKQLIHFFQHLFDSRQLYQHQHDSIKTVFKEHKNLVVTTGTGSGKSLCFIIPIILNILLEALGSNGRNKWNGGGTTEQEKWWEKDDSNFKHQRKDTNHNPALRCLIIYPLNALVQDQIETFRKQLNSAPADEFYRDVLNGERIYFGQYSGSTLGGGSESNKKQLDKCRRGINQMCKEYEKVKEEHKHRIQSPFGSELVTRWDMQAHPPDILITNYSMLAVMLVRKLEQNMFKKTRDWLAQSKHNNFYLVIDELHSYRGTAGSEISYIIKAFLEKINLRPDDPQLKIIGTSASMEEVDPGSTIDPKFLSDFFGTDNSKRFFSVIDGPQVTFESGQIEHISNLKDIFKDFFNTSRGGTDVLKTLEALRQKTNLTGKGGELLTNLKFEDVLDELTKIKGERSLTFTDICNKLFSGDILATKGFISLITYEGDETKDYQGQIRLNIFIKNLSGIVRSMRCESGKLISPVLYEKGVPYCTKHNAITLESLYCQDCGEIYYIGYPFEEGDFLFIRSEPPVLIGDEKSYVNYLNFRMCEKRDNWKQVYFNSITGELIDDAGPPPIPGHIAPVMKLTVEIKDPPRTCMHCGTNWKGRSDQVISPIRHMGTGYNKLNQVIIEQLLANLSTENNLRPKLVIFSDSRRDASRVAAELEHNHYLDVFRSTAEEILGDTKGATAKIKEFIKIAEQKNAEWGDVRDLDYAKNDFARDFFFEYIKGRLDKNKHPDEYRKAVQLKNESALPILSFNELAKELLNRIKDKGINPTGITTFSKTGDWPSVYSNLPSTIYTEEEKLDERNNILEEVKNQLRKTINDSMQRDFESLGFGWLTYPRFVQNTLSKEEIKLLDATIRYLSFHPDTRSLLYPSQGRPTGLLHKFFCDWARDSFQSIFSPEDSLNTISEFIRDLLNIFPGLINNSFQIDIEKLYIHRAQDYFWECNLCLSVQLFNPNEKCRRIKYKSVCSGSLQKKSIKDLFNRPNYYKEFSNTGRHKVPLRTEELIGHTDKADQRERQLAFQGIFTGDLSSRGNGKEDYLNKYFGIDILSVTTTMEAGVDIGELKSIYLANMPPRRFNYQQRVGRAGRRGDRLTPIVTFCKGQKHDEYYFQKPNLMVSEKTPSPKLDVTNQKIIDRVSLKFILNHLFSSFNELSNEIPTFNTIEGSTTGGSLGTLDSFKNSTDLIIRCLDLDNKNLSERLSKILIHTSSHQLKDLLIQLKRTIIKFSNDIEKLIQTGKYPGNKSASEVLALEGYFPIYGLPVRNTTLVHKNPNIPPNDKEWPMEKGIIDRKSDIAISEFAPLQEIIKDKQVIRCVGVGWLRKERGFIKGHPYSRRRQVYVCKSCDAISFIDAVICPQCAETDVDKFLNFQSWGPDYYIADFKDEPYKGHINSGRQYISEFPSLMDISSFIDGPAEVNYKIKSQEGWLIRANTNNFSGYGFRKIRRNVLPGAYIESEASKKVRTEQWKEKSENLDDQEKLTALTTEKRTDFLLVSLKNWPPQYDYRQESPDLKNCVRGAWRSLAEIIGRGIIMKEDIEPPEISVGIRHEFLDDAVGGQPKRAWAIYIADTLDNGAGYSSKYKDLDEFKKLIEYIQKYIVTGSLLSKEHPKECLSSCYHCIRHYENRFWHEMLDWRLGIDLFNLLTNPKSSVTKMNSYWKDPFIKILPERLGQFFDGHFTVEEIEDSVVYTHKTESYALFARHPLLASTSIDVQEEINTIRGQINSRIEKVIPFSIYDFQRNPIRVVQEIRATAQ
ncbi:DEAD/DEAH box helicase [Nitrospinae bacterium]|nr:DEAD/DEAH box helicase [Nitrospinota bacterium]